MKLSLCVCYDSCHHLLELLVRKRAGRVGRKEKKKENRTLGRLILWSGRLNDLQRKMEKSWPLSVHGLGDGSRRAALDVPAGARQVSQKSHPLSKRNQVRKRFVFQFQPSGPLTQSGHGQVAETGQWSPRAAGT